MKTITAVNYADCKASDLSMEGYEELKNYEHFIYSQNGYENLAIKINDNYAAFINGMGEFYLAQKYKNCLSVGSGYIVDFATFKDAVNYANHIKPKL